MEIKHIQSQESMWLRKFGMLIFAFLPILSWYKIPFPVPLGNALVLFLSAFVIIKSKFRINVLPWSFLPLFLYVCISWSYNHNFEINFLFPPGGWLFFIFTLALLGGVLLFDINLLKKYMRWVVYISMVLFWIQFVMKQTTGSYQFCFVPNLTGSFSYENMTYSELVSHQMMGKRPCSIFMEPSYMAYYYILYMALIWFDSDNDDSSYYSLINKDIVFVILTLITLKSGSGMIGMTILIIVKMFNVFWNVSDTHKVLFLLIIVPLIVFSINLYIDSEMGQEIISRQEEFSREGSSGYSRVVAGYAIFDMMSSYEQLFGNYDARNIYGIVKPDGKVIFYVNGVQSILIFLGYVGVLLYLIFYSSLFCKVSLMSKMTIITLLTMALLESNYLNPYMMLLSIIPCADYHYYKKSLKNEIAIY